MQFGDQDSESDEDGGHTQRLRFEPCIAIASHSLHHACTCMHLYTRMSSFSVHYCL